MAANVNNYISAGNAAVRKAVMARKALAENKPRYDEMGMEAVSQEAQNTANIAKNNSLTAQARMNAESRVKKQAMKASADKYEQGQYKKARMTGLLAGGIAMAGIGINNMNKKEEENELLTAYQQRLTNQSESIASLTAKLNERQNEYENMPKGDAKPPESEKFESRPYPGSDDDTSSDNTENTNNTQNTNNTVTTSSTDGNKGSGLLADGSVDPAAMYSYLTKTKGLSKNKAYGIMANIQRESGFRPKIASGDDGGAGGLFQWKGSRQTEKVRQLVAAGDWRGQIDYALTEPGEAYTTTFLESTFDSPQSAADGWMRGFERPLDPVAGSKKHTQFLSTYKF